MDKQQVDIVGLQLTQALINARRRLFLTRVGNPHFRHQKNILSGDTAFADRFSHTLFVEVSLGSVDQTVTDIQSVTYISFSESPEIRARLPAGS